MARAKINSVQAPGGYPSAGVLVPFTASDVSNGNYFTFTGKELLVVRNTAGSGGTFTIHSAPNQRGRTKDITTEALAAGAYKVLGPFTQKVGWAQSDGTFWVNGSATTIAFAVIVLPSR